MVQKQSHHVWSLQLAQGSKHVCVWGGLVIMHGRLPKVGMWLLAVPAVWGVGRTRWGFPTVTPFSKVRQKPSKET